MLKSAMNLENFPIEGLGILIANSDGIPGQIKTALSNINDEVVKTKDEKAQKLHINGLIHIRNINQSGCLAWTKSSADLNSAIDAFNNFKTLGEIMPSCYQYTTQVCDFLKTEYLSSQES